MLRQVMMGLAAVAGLAVWVAQPAQAKDWPNGYDPQSGLTWEEDFTYSPWNPFGSPPGAYGRPDFFFRGGPQFAPPGSYSYGSPSYSYGALAPRQDNMARIRLVVPDGAKVWFDNQLMKQSGTERNFESPALTPDRTYHYDVKVKWLDKDGKDKTQTRRIDVRANGNQTVDFTRPSGS